MNINKYIEETITTKQKILKNKKLLNTLDTISNIIVEAYRDGHKVITAGNGGSAADAQHIVGELVSKFNFDRKPLAAIELNTNSPLLTAISNDYDYKEVFARQIQANGSKGDIFIGISTSGVSQNIIRCVEMANEIGITTICLTGEHDCPLDNLCKYIIKVPSTNTPIIQESQIMIGHILCGLVESKIFN